MSRHLRILVAALVVAAVTSACSENPTGARVVAWFPSAVSLYPNSDVKIMGLDVGRIQKVEPLGTRVRVQMRLREGVPLPTDVEATIVPVSLIGERYVQLMPAWLDGQPLAGDDVEIPIERTHVPVEPDEALAAFKKLLDDLDPNATGRLITNLGEDLDGQGEQLNKAIRGISQLTATLADKDAQIGGIIDAVDRLSTTLRTREVQLGALLQDFAETARLLAEERLELQKLISGLARFGSSAYELVVEHRASLQKDLGQLQRLLSALSTNLEHVDKLLSAGPIMVAGEDLDGKGAGAIAAYDPTHHVIDLRSSASPLVAGLLGGLLGTLGIPSPNPICLPVDVTCAPAASAEASAAAAAPDTEATPQPTTPIDGILGLVMSPSAGGRGQPVASDVSERGSWLRRAARRVLGVLA